MNSHILKDALIFIKAFLNDVLSSKTESLVDEILMNEEVVRATLPETLFTVVLRYQHISLKH